MLCEIRAFKRGDGSFDVSRWWIKTNDKDMRYWASCGTHEEPFLYRSIYPCYFRSKEEAIRVATLNGLEVEYAGLFD